MYSEEPGDLFNVISDDSVERALSLKNQTYMNKFCKLEYVQIIKNLGVHMFMISVMYYLSDSSQISNADWWSPPSVEWECGGDEGDAVTEDVDPE